jgi:predicted dehydrogenase
VNSRRQFLQRTAGTAGALGAPLMGRQAARANGANDRVGIALIGCGGMGRINLSQFLRQKEAHCVALCDVDDANIDKAKTVIQDAGGQTPEFCWRDFRRVLERKDVDAVVIAAPDHWHALMTIMACQAGKDVYVQKPLATSIGEAHAMVEAARTYKRIVQVGTQQRSLPQFQQCVDYVRSGKLGTIRQIRCYSYLSGQGELKPVPDSSAPAGVDYDMWLGPAPQRPFNENRFHFKFRYFWDYAGGAMTDWGAHMLDIAMWATGGRLPLAALSAGGKYVWPNDAKQTPDTQQVLYEFPGMLVVWEHAMGIGHGPGSTKPNEHGVMFYGQNGVALVDRWGWEVFPEVDAFPSTQSEYRMAGVPRREFRNEPGLHEKHFLECLRSRKRPRADVSDGYSCMVACHLGNLAYRLGRKMHWDAELQRITGDDEAQKLVTYQYRSPWKLVI